MYQTFKVKSEHIKLLEKAIISENNAGFSSFGIDPEMPFGERDVYKSIADILEINPFEDSDERSGSSEQYSDSLIDELSIIYEELSIVLEILLHNISIGIHPALYHKNSLAADKHWSLLDGVSLE